MAVAIAAEEVLMVVAAVAPAAERVAVMVAGATGLVGREVLAALLADRRTGTVHALGRKAPGLQAPQVVAHTVDFARLPVLPRVDEVYIALGTTIKTAGSQQAFRAIDLDAVVAIAAAARAAGAKRLGIVSAMGADARAKVFYNRTKGEMEQAVAALGFDTLVLARPSLLVGDRAALDQPTRPGERAGLWLSRLLKPVIPGNYLPIRASRVAASLVAAVRDGPAGQRILLSGAMQ
jgi:uncharacterized protein YbjT (DUF2867 family)